MTVLEFIQKFGLEKGNFHHWSGSSCSCPGLGPSSPWECAICSLDSRSQRDGAPRTEGPGRRPQIPGYFRIGGGEKTPPLCEHCTVLVLKDLGSL